MAEKIGLVLALDGEKEFTENLRAAKAAVQEAEASLKDLNEKYKESANTKQALIDKQKALADVTEKLNERERVAREGLNLAKKNAQEITDNIEKLEVAVDEAKATWEEYNDTFGKNDELTKEAKKEYKDLEKQLSAQRAEYHKEIKAQATWNTEITKAKTALRANGKAVEENSKYLKEAEHSSDGLAKSIDNTGKKIKETSNAADDLGDELKDTSDDMKDASEEAEGFGDALDKSFGKNRIAELGLDLLKKMAQEAFDAIKEGLKVGIDFEAQMSRVGAISGATGDEFQQLQDKAEQLGRETVYSATESAEAMEQMALAGWRTQDIISGIDGVLSLAASSGMSIGSAAEYVSDNIHAWGEESSYASEMADIMAAAMSHSSMTTEDLGEAYGKTAATAHALGFDIADVTAVLMGMANQGRKGGEAGSSLNTILTRLATNTSHCADQLGDLGVQIYDSDGKMRSLSAILDDTAVVWETLGEAERNALAKTVAGTRQFNAFSMVMKSVSDEAKASGRSMEDFKRILESSEGSADRMADTMLNNVKGSVTLLKDALEGLAIVLFDKINVPLKSFIDYLAAAVTRTANFFDGTKDSTSAMAESIAETRDALKGLKEQTDQETESAEMQGKRAEILIEYLRELNSEEELSEFQKQRVKEIVAELNDIYPDLTLHIDEQTGKVKEGSEQLKRYADNLKEALIAEAMMSKANGYADAVADAKVALAMGEQELEHAKKRKDFYEGYYKMLNDLSVNEFSGATTEELISRQTQAWEEALKVGAVTFDEYQAGLAGIATSFSDINAGYLSTFLEQSGLAEVSIKALTEQVDGLAIQYDEATGELEAVISVTDDYSKKSDIQSKAIAKVKESAADLAPKAANLGLAFLSAATGVDAFGLAASIAASANDAESASIKKVIGDTEDFQDSQMTLRKVIKGTQEVAETPYETKMAERAKDAASIVEQSANDMGSAWDSLVEQAKSALDGLDMKDAWDGGGVTTTWTLLDNLESQINGLEEYSANLDKLKEHIGKEVSPEFFKYMQDMGLAGADFVSNILLALESDGGPERVAEISEKYAQRMNIEDVIAEQWAANGAALYGELKDFGSSEEEFDALRKSIENSFDGISTDTRANLMDLVDQCQAIGVKLPEGIAESIENGDVSSTADVGSKLEAAILGTLQGLEGAVEENGGTISEELAQGIADGSVSVEEAYNQLLEQLADISPNSSKIEEAVETGFGDPIISGLEAQQERVSEATSGIVDTAISSLAEGNEAFEASGRESVSKFASGVTEQKEEAAAAIATMVASAINAANAQTGSAGTLGYNIAAGVARGIDNGSGTAAQAAVRMINRLFNAAQKAADTHSPSKRAEKVLGIQIPAGVAKGIDKGSQKSADAAAAMVGQLFYEAQKAMSKGKGKAKTIAELWDKTLNVELTKVDKKNKNKQFQLSWFTTSGTGKNAKKVKKDAETYYGEVVQIAQTYFSNIQALEETSEREEYDYWSKIAKHVKKGTQAWYDAQGKVNEIKRSMGSFDVASSILSEYSSYYEVSAAAEVEYWKKVLKNYKEGSSDYIAAQNELLRAQKNLNDKEKEINQKHADALVEANKEKEESIKSLTRTIMDAYDIYDEFVSDAPTPEELLFNIKAQAAGYEEWQKGINELKNKGLSDDLMQEIIDKGVAGVAAVAALNMLSAEQLKEYQDAYNRKLGIAKDTAQNDKSIEEAYKKAVEEANKARTAELAELKKPIDSSLATFATNLKTILSDEVTKKIVDEIKKKSGSTTATTPTTSAKTQTPVTPTTPTKTQMSGGATGTRDFKSEVKAAISGAKKHAKTITQAEKNSHSDLWEHLAKNYGIDADAEIMKRLAKLFGIKVGSSVSKSEKDAILKAMKAKGLASGNKRLSDLFAWMDENGIGSEMIIRKSDGARLNTNVQPGDAIVPALNTNNLWEWSKVAPSEMLNAIAMQNAMTQQYVNDMARSINVAKLNGSLAGSSGSAVVLSDMMRLMSSYLPYLAQRTRISVDGRKFVEATSDYTSRDLATRMRRKMV